MAAVRDEERICEIEAIPGVPVHRAWDLGIRDDTAIWWFQAVGSQCFILDCYAASGVGVEHFTEVVEQRAKMYGWVHGTDYVPHDAKIKEWGSGRTRIETMVGLGLNPTLVPLATVADGINAVRRLLPLCVFHPRCEDEGCSALEQYRREWDDDKKAFRANAVHDWTSHYADAMRYLAQAFRFATPKKLRMPEPRGIILPPPPEPSRRGIVL